MTKDELLKQIGAEHPEPQSVRDLQIAMNEKWLEEFEAKTDKTPLTDATMESVKRIIDNKAYAKLFAILLDYDKLCRERSDKHTKECTGDCKCCEEAEHSEAPWYMQLFQNPSIWAKPSDTKE